MSVAQYVPLRGLVRARSLHGHMRTVQRSVPGNGRTVQFPVHRSTVRLHTLKPRHEGGAVASSRFNRNEVPAIVQRGEIERF